MPNLTNVLIDICALFDYYNALIFATKIFSFGVFPEFCYKMLCLTKFKSIFAEFFYIDQNLFLTASIQGLTVFKYII